MARALLLRTGMAEHRILVVDDEQSILFGVREYMQARGHVVECSRTAADALERLSSQTYDVVTVDLCLERGEDADGLAVVEHARRVDPRAHIVVLTGCGAAMEAEARRRGADLFLQKPQLLGDLADLVGRLCEGDR